MKCAVTEGATLWAAWMAQGDHVCAIAHLEGRRTLEGESLDFSCGEAQDRAIFSGLNGGFAAPPTVKPNGWGVADRSVWRERPPVFLPEYRGRA